MFETARETSGAFWVAVEDDGLVGFVCVFGLVAPSEPDQYPDKFSAVTNIHALPSLQGRGIGTALMRRAEDYALGRGAGKLELTAPSENRRAIDFYRQLGYRERSLRPISTIRARR